MNTKILADLNIWPLPQAHHKYFILIACEKSQTVGREFANIKDAYVLTCDIQAAYESDALPPNMAHYQGDIFDVLHAGWHLMIGHPPCTYLTNAAAWCLHRPDQFPERWDQLRDGAIFFWDLLNAPIPLIAIENPVMVGYAKLIIGRGQDCTFQPYHHGDPVSKQTCLWLKGLPSLKPTDKLDKPSAGHWENQTPSGQNKLSPSADRGDLRSDFSPRVARAMRDQWEPILLAQAE